MDGIDPALLRAELQDDLDAWATNGFESQDHEPETRMTPEQIVELKEILNEDSELKLQVYATLALHMVAAYEASHRGEIFEDERAARFQCVVLYDDIMKFADEALGLEDGEWLTGVDFEVRPEQLHETLESLRLPPLAQEDPRG